MKLFTDKIQINRNEISGAFGDIGTDLPLIIAMLSVSDLHSSNVLIVFGIMQIITSFLYGLPMPVQPLKAVAMIVITQKISSSIIFGGSLAIGLSMFLLTITGLITFLNKIIPKTVIRGVQFGLGLQLCLLSLKDYIPAERITGYILAFTAFTFGLFLIGNKKYPPAIFILILGFAYAIIFNSNLLSAVNLNIPQFIFPEITYENVLTGFIVLALPQIPLSLGNSIFATSQLIKDYFPEKQVSIKKIGFTYSAMNIIGSFAGGIPTCHGSGGIAGHYTFGGRTGGSTLIYGVFYILFGLFFSLNPNNIFQIFPKPILGVILLFEGITLIILMKDIIFDKRNFFIAILVGLIANGLAYGYLIGMVFGTVLCYFPPNWILNGYGKNSK
ncbi:MAG: putative sulfate/molybdate transporter [Leptospiraceae bacterium]|nr:putative sulfate/molybdate transporter [Leptospiraceae bacterium]